jgi:acetyl esterase
VGIDKETRDVVRDIAAYPALVEGDPDINKIRAAYNEVFAAWTAPSLAPTEEHWVEEHGITSLIIRPLNKAAGAGTIIFIHGGGWSLGTALCYAPLGRHLAGMSGMTVILPDFPQSPEAPFPAAFDALRGWLSAKLRDADEPYLLSGDSAGATLSAVLSHEEGIAGHLAGQGLLYPVTDLRPGARYRSRRRFGSGKYFLTTDGIIGAAMMYLGTRGDANDPRISPILQEDVSASPPTFFLFPEYDPLRDEGEAYAQKLKKAGVQTEIRIARQTIHGCASFSGRIPAGRVGMEQMATIFQEWATV